MRILFVSSQAMYPSTRFGGAKRLYYLAKELERRAELKVLCLDGNFEGAPPKGGFIHEMLLPLDAPRARPGRLEFMPGVAGLFAAKRGAILEFLGDGGFDATMLAYPAALRFLDCPWGRDLGRLIFADDDLLVDRYSRMASSGPFLRRMTGWFRYRQALRFFRERMAKLDECLCISPEEEAVIRRLFPMARTRVLPYGLPLEEYACLPPDEPAGVLGFIGNFRHSPNVDALEWLLNELLPALLAKRPASRLVVAGLHLPPSLEARCRNEAAVRLMLEVEDLSSFYAAIGSLVIPVREGRGLRTKAVEAAAFGRPVIATPLGAEGLRPIEAEVFRDTAGFLEACARLDAPGFYRKRAEANRLAVESDFSLTVLGDNLTGILSGRRP